MKTYRKIFITVVVFTIAIVSGAFASLKMPENTVEFLYIKDVVNLEKNLKKAGLLLMRDKSLDYLLDYFEDQYKLLGMYKKFRGLDDGNILKSLIGEMYFVKYMNQYIILVKAKKSSVFFVNALKAAKGGKTFYGYEVDTIKDYLILGKNSTTMSYFKENIDKPLKNAMLRKQLAKNRDIVYYKRDNKIFHPFIDNMFGLPGSTKSFTLGINFEKKSFEIYADPADKSKRTTVLKRSKNSGIYIPENVIVFVDTADNPIYFFEKLFGAEGLKFYTREFKQYFRNQTTFALTGFSTSISPSYILTIRAYKSGDFSTGQFFKKFIGEMLDKKSYSKKIGKDTAYVFEGSGLAYIERNGYFIIADSENTLRQSIQVATGKNPSIWASTKLGSLRKTVEKKYSSFIFDFENFAAQVYSSMQKQVSMNKTQKTDVKDILRSLKKMGVLIGYSEKNDDYIRYYLVLKPLKK